MATVSQRRNSSFTGAPLLYATYELEFEAHDSLPSAIRWAIEEAPTKLSSASVLRVMEHNGLRHEAAVRYINGKLAMLERAELAAFVQTFEGITASTRDKTLHGMRYPHTAANATKQTYGALGPSRHPPRRFGPPVIHGRSRRVKR